MKYVLDFKDYTARLNETFYRYNIVDCCDNIIAVVWFSQKEDSGNIYTVYVRLSSEKFKDFDIYVIDYAHKYYPQGYEILIPHIKLSDDSSVEEHIKKVKLVNIIAHKVMDILREEEHTQKYMKGH